MSPNLEPERIYCSAGECLEEALLIGHVTLEVDARAGAAEEETRQTFQLPLCPHHSHLLRFDNRLVDFDNGMRDRDPK